MKSTGVIKGSKFKSSGTVKCIIPNVNALSTCFNSIYINYVYCYKI